MNIHPFIVHFPVAFLSVYSILELIRIKYITSAAYWFYIKASMVIVGTVGAAAAYISGKSAAKLLGESQLVELHAKFAGASVILFGFIGILYGVAWLSRLEITTRIENYLKLGETKTYSIFKRIINHWIESFLMIIMAVAGLTLIIITGALGGAIVYGPDNDPAIRLIYDLLSQH